MLDGDVELHDEQTILYLGMDWPDPPESDEPAMPAGPCDCAHAETPVCMCGHPRSGHADCGRGPCRTNVSLALWHDSDDRKVIGCRCRSYHKPVETREIETNG